MILRDRDVMLTVVRESRDVLLIVVSSSPRQFATCQFMRTVSDSVAWRPWLGGSQDSCEDEERDAKPTSFEKTYQPEYVEEGEGNDDEKNSMQGCSLTGRIFPGRALWQVLLRPLTAAGPCVVGSVNFCDPSKYDAYTYTWFTMCLPAPAIYNLCYTIYRMSVCSGVCVPWPWFLRCLCAGDSFRLPGFPAGPGTGWGCSRAASVIEVPHLAPCS